MKKILLVLLLCQILLVSSVMAAEKFTDEDFSMASMNLNDTYEKVESVLGKLIYIKSYDNEIARCKVNIYGVQGLRVGVAFYSKTETSLWSVEAITPMYATSRGNKVGDGTKHVLDKYGEPGFKDTFKDDKTGKTYERWSYEDMEKMRRIVFKIDPVKNVVASITISMIID